MSKGRPALGKGLSALIPGAAFDEHQGADTPQEMPVATIALSEGRKAESHREEEGISKIEIARIAPNPLQPRKDFAPEALEELTESIREHGVIQPITVRRVADGRYELVTGERRVRASIEAGLRFIPAYVMDVATDRKMLELAIVENVQRQQFNVIEEAEAYQRLIEECGLTQEDVADRISKDRSTVTNFLRLLRLPDTIKDSLRKGELGMGHAKAILSVPAPERQVQLWKQAVAERYSVRKMEEVVRKALREADQPKQPVRKPKEDEEFVQLPEVDSMQNRLKQLLGTQVQVRLKKDSTGEVTVQFYSREDLERILELLLTVRNY